MTEREFQQQVVDFARLLGWRCYHTFDSRRSSAGFPDLVLVRHGRLIFAELKVGAGKLSVDQRDWMADLIGVANANHGVIAAVWRPEDWAWIEAMLNPPRRSKR